MHIERSIEKEMKDFLFQGKVLVVYGARQTGKTTAASHFLISFATVHPDNYDRFLTAPS